MIEAVNSVVSNANLLRTQPEQVVQQRPETASLERVEAPLAPFISPYIQVNTQYDKAVIQIRDADTGDVLNQYPSEETLASRQALQAQQAAASAPVNTDSEPVSGSLSGLSASSLGGGQAVEISVSSSAPSSQGIPNIAQAQLASAALNASAATGQAVTTNVSVTA